MGEGTSPLPKEAVTAAQVGKEAITAINIPRVREVVGRFVEQTHPQQTLIPLFNLRVANTLRENRGVTDEELAIELQSLSRIIDTEQEAFEDPSIPSIGTEVDIYRPWLYRRYGFRLNNTLDTLSRLGIPTKPEIAGVEFQLPPTSSAEAQAEMIHELIRMRIFPETISKTAMHINFGLQPNQEQNLDLEVGNYISDILTYAFVPSSRLLRRFTGFLAHKSSVDINEIDGVNIKTGKRGPMKKLEFRTPQLIGQQTGDLLQSAQNLVQLMLNPHLQELAGQFRTDTQQLLREHNLSLNAPDTHQIQTALKLRKARQELRESMANDIAPEDVLQRNLVSQAGKIVTTYSQKIGA